MKSCVFCGGALEKKHVTFTYEENAKYLLVEHVPADVCTRCGEKLYAPKVTDELLKFATDQLKPVKTIKVPVFDFAMHETL